MASGAIVATSSGGTTPADSPRNTSAPFSASVIPPDSPFGLVCSAISALYALRFPRSLCRMPCESSSVMSRIPLASNIFAHATPAAPAPETTTRSELMSRSSTFAAPSSAASTTIAVPCWSSCITGQSSASMRRRSISKQRGAEMSSRFTAPNVGRSRTRVSTISSGSLVSSTIGIESRSANALNSALLPSITGSDAAGPMSPSPRTALPSLTTATMRLAHVYRAASVWSAAIARLT